MKIAVYPGSFNPMHIGHRSVLTHLDGFDRIILIVSPQNPFKDASNIATAQERFERAKAAVEKIGDSRMYVDDIELHMDPPHYTIRTLDALRERFPGDEITLIIGADNLSGFRGWKDYTRVLKEYGVAVFPRQGYDRHKMKMYFMQEDAEYRIDLLDMEPVDVSSTQIRSALKKGEDVSSLVI